MNKTIFRVVSASLAAVFSLAAQPVQAQPSSESTRIEQLEREIAELKREVNALKEQREPVPEGKMKTKITTTEKRTSKKPSQKKSHRFMCSNAERN